MTEDKPKIWKHPLIWFVAGFLFYPMFFVPIMYYVAPGVMFNWIYIYAEYLRLWGI